MPKAEKKTVKTVTEAQKKKGLLLALLAIPAGIVAWDILWGMGFLASISTFVTAWVAITLYTKSTGAKPDMAAAKWLLGIIVAGVALSFLSGMAMDAQVAYSEVKHIAAFDAFASADFWSFFMNNLGYGDVWGQYTSDIVLSLLFAVLGAYGIVKDLFVPEPQQKETK